MGGSRDAKTIDLSKVEMIADYESGERRFDIVPGANRYPEDGFVGTNAFGAVYRGIGGKIAGLGVKMEIEAHDVAVDGILLSVCARASANRFKILRVVQTEPYIIVDAVPYDDDFANASMDEDVSEAEQNLLDALETLKSNDNYYYEAVGLQYDEDPSTGKISVKKLIEPEFKSFTLSEIFLYNKDDVVTNPREQISKRARGNRHQHCQTNESRNEVRLKPSKRSRVENFDLLGVSLCRRKRFDGLSAVDIAGF